MYLNALGLTLVEEIRGRMHRFTKSQRTITTRISSQHAKLILQPIQVPHPQNFDCSSLTIQAHAVVPDTAQTRRE